MRLVRTRRTMQKVFFARSIWGLLAIFAVVIAGLLYGWDSLQQQSPRPRGFRVDGGLAAVVLDRGDTIMLYVEGDGGFDSALGSDEMRATIEIRCTSSDDSFLFSTHRQYLFSAWLRDFGAASEPLGDDDVRAVVETFFVRAKERLQNPAVQRELGASHQAVALMQGEAVVGVARRLESPLGYALNMAFILGHVYALALFVVMCSPAYWSGRRRHHRVADSLCPNCEYSIRGLKEPRCPECGATFPAHALDRRPEEEE